MTETTAVAFVLIGFALGMAGAALFYVFLDWRAANPKWLRDVRRSMKDFQRAADALERSLKSTIK